MQNIDLHTHSNFSDGTDSPAQLIENAVNAGLAAVALTDHDTVAGIDDALKYIQENKPPIRFIPGTELSAGFRDGDIHIVGLFIRHDDPAFKKISDLMVERRIQRNYEMAENLRKAGIPITIEALTSNNPDTVVTRAHFARFLVNNNFVKDIGEAFEKYLDVTSPYYVPRKFITPEEAVTTILKAGGLPILAHPMHYKLENDELESLVERLIDAGLKGIEVKYSNHTEQMEEYVKSLAKKKGLLPSGGSDYHGTNKPDISIGTGRGTLSVPYEYLEKLEQGLKQG